MYNYNVYNVYGLPAFQDCPSIAKTSLFIRPIFKMLQCAPTTPIKIIEVLLCFASNL